MRVLEGSGFEFRVSGRVRGAPEIGLPPRFCLGNANGDWDKYCLEETDAYGHRLRSVFIWDNIAEASGILRSVGNRWLILKRGVPAHGTDIFVYDTITDRVWHAPLEPFPRKFYCIAALDAADDDNALVSLSDDAAAQHKSVIIKLENQILCPRGKAA